MAFDLWNRGGTHGQAWQAIARSRRVSVFAGATWQFSQFGRLARHQQCCILPEPVGDGSKVNLNRLWADDAASGLLPDVLNVHLPSARRLRLFFVVIYGTRQCEDSQNIRAPHADSTLRCG